MSEATVIRGVMRDHANGHGDPTLGHSTSRGYVCGINNETYPECADYDCPAVAVIYPHDGEQAAAMIAVGWRLSGRMGRFGGAVVEVERWEAMFTELAENPQLAHPPEPTGIGAVVEDSQGQRWVRGHASDIAPWVRVWTGGDRAPLWRYWTGIHAPRVLSKGVTP